MSKNTQFLCKEKPNLGKKLQDKTMSFSKESDYQTAKAERFIKIVKRLNILRVVANFKKSTNEHP